MTNELLKPALLEGGFIQVRPKMWKGTIRTREEKRILWRCSHNHSRPEYNARYSANPEQVWEMSALNCGRSAYRQLLEGEKKVTGDPGLVGDPNFPVHLRDDTRSVRVGKKSYMGTLRLTDNGERSLKVAHLAEPKEVGAVNLDLPPEKGLHPPVGLAERALREWLTATWLLKGTVWGVVFQDSDIEMHTEGVIPRAVEELLETERPSQEGKKEAKPTLDLPTAYKEASRKASRKTSRGTVASDDKKLPSQSSDEALAAKRTDPHIRVAREKGRRVFEVVGWTDDVIETFIHRGKAIEKLDKVLQKGRP